MRLTRRRRRKIYRVVGIIAIILFLIGLIIVNPFQYIHIEFKPKKESTVLKEDDKTKDKDKEKEEAEKKLNEEEEKKKAEEEAKKKAEEEKKKKEQEEKEKEKDKKGVYYTVTFFNKDGSVIYSTSFKQGSVPYYNGETPKYYDDTYYYEFVGWDKVFKAIYSNTSYVAQFKIVGYVPHPTPQPDPDPEEPEDDPDEPVEPVEPEEPENPDLSEYNFFHITNIGEKDGKVQILKTIGDYSDDGFPEIIKKIAAPEINIQYSFDRKEWKDFESYSYYDLCGTIVKYYSPSLYETYPFPEEINIIDGENPLILKPEETVYFRATPGHDNTSFMQINKLVLGTQRDQIHETIPGLDTFDLRGVDESDGTKFNIGGDLISIIDDDYIAEKCEDTNGNIIETCDPYGCAGMFANISDQFIQYVLGVKPKAKLYLQSRLQGKPSLMNQHNGDNVESARELNLPDFEETPANCYGYMFADSNSLKEVPVLTNVKVGRGCFYGMFISCDGIEKYTDILSSPLVVDGEEIGASCYSELFSYCTNLKEVASNILPLTELASYCYDSMFVKTSITTLPTLPATTLKDGCYYRMFSSCRSISSAVDLTNYLNATTIAPYCYAYMFSNTNITSAPNLIATNVFEGSYDSMFANCPNLVHGPVISVETFDESCDISDEYFVYPFQDIIDMSDKVEDLSFNKVRITEDKAPYFRYMLRGAYDALETEEKKCLYIPTYTTASGNYVTTYNIMDMLVAAESVVEDWDENWDACVYGK